MKTSLVMPLATLNGWSMRQLAERANVHQTAISDWLRGEPSRLSESRAAQVLEVLELDGDGSLRKNWVYRWRLGEGFGGLLDLKSVIVESAIDGIGVWDELPLLLDRMGEFPMFLAFQEAAGVRALVHLFSKSTRPRKSSQVKMAYPTPRELGDRVRWCPSLAAGSSGVMLTPDQANMLLDPMHDVTPELFDALVMGDQFLPGEESLKSYRGINWEKILEALKRRYSSPEVAAFFLKINSSNDFNK